MEPKLNQDHPLEPSVASTEDPTVKSWNKPSEKKINPRLASTLEMVRNFDFGNRPRREKVRINQLPAMQKIQGGSDSADPVDSPKEGVEMSQGPMTMEEIKKKTSDLLDKHMPEPETIPEEIKFQIEQIDEELRSKLSNLGVKIEVVDALMNLAIYDYEEKVLKIRQDADLEFVDEYIQNNILKEQDGVDELDPRSETTEILPNEPTVTISNVEPKENTIQSINLAEKKPSEWGLFNTLLSDLNVDLEFNEEQFKKFQEKNPDGLEQKSREMKEVIESFPNKNLLREKFSTIRLGYPKYGGDSSIFIEDNKLYVDLAIDRQEMANFLNNLFNTGPIDQTQTEPKPELAQPRVVFWKPPISRPTAFEPPRETEQSTGEIKNLSDMLNQPQGQPAEAEQKPAETSPENPEALLEDQKEGKELKELEELRTLLAQAENRKKDSSGAMLSMDLPLENLRAEYEEKKEALARMLREKLTGVAGGQLNKEQQKLFDDTVFEEIIKKESDAYISSLREARKNSGGMAVKIQEGMKSFLGLSAIQWYRKQDKYKRIGAIAVLAGIGIGGGMFLGGAAASTALASGIGTVVYRGGRGLASAGVMVGVGKVGKKSIEKIDEKEKQDIENIRDSGKSLAEKAADFLKIREGAEKQRRKVMMITGATSVAGGVGAGIGAGAAMDMFADYYGIGGLSSSGPESKAQKEITETLENKKAGNVSETKPSVPVEQIESNGIKVEELKHTPDKGDSNWGLLKETLEHNDRFAKLEHSGQKSFVLSMFNNKVLSDPTEYSGGGVGADGSIAIGREVDYSKLFEDKEWVNKVLEKAKNLPADRIKLIEENDAKISAWVKDPAHHGQKLDGKTVEEILNTKPKSEPLIIRPAGGNYKHVTDLEPPSNNKMQEAVDSILEKPKIGPQEIEGKTMLAGGGIVAASALSRNPGNFGVIEGGRKDGVDHVRSLQGDSKRAIAEILSAEKVEEHFRNDINAIYGKKGVLGIGKQEGIDTAEWKEISPQNASKVLDYYKNPENSDLPKKMVENLSVSEPHRKLIAYVDFLRKEGVEATKISGGGGVDVIPYKEESVVDYVKRLGKFVAEHPRPPANEVPEGQVMEATLFKKAA